MKDMFLPLSVCNDVVTRFDSRDELLGLSAIAHKMEELGDSLSFQPPDTGTLLS